MRYNFILCILSIDVLLFHFQSTLCRYSNVIRAIITFMPNSIQWNLRGSGRHSRPNKSFHFSLYLQYYWRSSRGFCFILEILLHRRYLISLIYFFESKTCIVNHNFFQSFRAFGMKSSAFWHFSPKNANFVIFLYSRIAPLETLRKK